MIHHLFHSYTVCDDDPAYAVRFKNAFTTNLKASQRNCNLKWLLIATALDPRFTNLKCVSKDNKEEVLNERLIFKEHVKIDNPVGYKKILHYFLFGTRTLQILNKIGDDK